MKAKNYFPPFYKQVWEEIQNFMYFFLGSFVLSAGLYKWNKKRDKHYKSAVK